MVLQVRFDRNSSVICYNEQDGALAEKLGTGLQNQVDGSVTRTCLHIKKVYARVVESVDTRDLKSLGRKGRAGSSPAPRTR